VLSPRYSGAAWGDGKKVGLTGGVAALSIPVLEAWGDGVLIILGGLPEMMAGDDASEAKGWLLKEEGG